MLVHLKTASPRAAAPRNISSDALRALRSVTLAAAWVVAAASAQAQAGASAPAATDMGGGMGGGMMKGMEGMHSGMAGGAGDMRSAMMSGMDEMQKVQPTGDIDRDFALMMRVHHQQAVTMAEALLERGKSPELKTMARGIIDAQRKEITQFDQWLAQHK